MTDGTARLQDTSTPQKGPLDRAYSGGSAHVTFLGDKGKRIHKKNTMK